MKKQRVDSLYNFDGDESVLLHRSCAELSIDKNNYAGDCEIRLDLFPRPAVRIYCNFKSDQYDYYHVFKAFDDETIPVTLSINSQTINGFITNLKKNQQGFSLKWCLKSEPINMIGDNDTQIARVVFHLFNFLEFMGTRRSTEQTEDMLHAIEHVDLISDEWMIELKSLITTHEGIKKLKKEGGYQLTHMGSIQKVTGTLFTGKEVIDILNALRFFLSFAKGVRCSPVCAVGLDTAENRVWESWSSPQGLWRSSFSWFDPHHSSQLASLFPGFMKRWTDKDWHEALVEVIYWYLNANNTPFSLEAGIILAQAAIERMSYEFSVKEKKLITLEGFKNLWTSDKFRLFFSSLKIPLEIPSDTPQLQKLACKGQMNWLDAPHALTEIRNSLVHPEHKKHGHLNAAHYEAWNLMLWYLEMALLAICGYSGTYGNRLKQRWIGQVEDVPWH